MGDKLFEISLTNLQTCFTYRAWQKLCLLEIVVWNAATVFNTEKKTAQHPKQRFSQNFMNQNFGWLVYFSALKIGKASLYVTLKWENDPLSDTDFQARTSTASWWWWRAVWCWLWWCSTITTGPQRPTSCLCGSGVFFSSGFPGSWGWTDRSQMSPLTVFNSYQHVMVCRGGKWIKIGIQMC